MITKISIQYFYVKTFYSAADPFPWNLFFRFLKNFGKDAA